MLQCNPDSDDKGDGDAVFEGNFHSVRTGADRGPRAGSPRGVVVATRSRIHVEHLTLVCRNNPALSHTLGAPLIRSLTLPVLTCSKAAALQKSLTANIG